MMGVHGVCLKLPGKTRRFKVHSPGRFMSDALLLHLCMSESVVWETADENAITEGEVGTKARVHVMPIGSTGPSKTPADRGKFIFLITTLIFFIFLVTRGLTLLAFAPRPPAPLRLLSAQFGL